MADLKFSELTMKVEFGIKFQGNVATQRTLPKL